MAYKRINTPQGSVKVPDEVTEDMVQKVIDAGWRVTGPDWMPSRMDRFTKVSERGVTYRLMPTYRPNGTFAWQTGMSQLVDDCYSEYCRFYTSVSEALARELW